MSKELDERFENVYENIEQVYYKLTHLNMQYHHLVRNLERTRDDLKVCQQELMVCYRIEALGNEGQPYVKRLAKASRMLKAGGQIIKEIFPKIRDFTIIVDRMMDANDHVEDCLNLMDEFRT